MDSESIIQILVFLLWVFGGRILRALRGGQDEPESKPEDDLEDWNDEWRLPEKAAPQHSLPPLSEDGRLPQEITTLEELHELETRLEEIEQVAQRPVKQDYEAISHLLAAYDKNQRLGEHPNAIPPPRSELSAQVDDFSEKTTGKAVLLDGFLLSEILGMPRAYRSSVVGGFGGVPRVVKKL